MLSFIASLIVAETNAAIFTFNQYLEYRYERFWG
jgi:hypothetical protein